MTILLGFDGMGFRRQGQPLAASAVARWLRWRRPRWIVLEHAGQQRLLAGQQFQDLLEQPGSVAAWLQSPARASVRSLDATRPAEPTPVAQPSHEFDPDYQMLGLPPGAKGKRLQHAYRRLAKLHHPDHGGSVVHMQALNRAYRRLLEASVVIA